MATTTLQTVCRHLRKLAGAQDAADATDRQLLQRFLDAQDEAAFAELLKRHGPMVLGVCRRVLGNAADADDAFQATFLVLAQRAASIRRAEALASWLYGTAYRCALEIRRKAIRRRAHEEQARTRTQPNPELEAALRELQTILDEEVHRLPEKLQTPFVLCALEGLSKPEAARALGWKEGTVSGRLAQARERLRVRLAQRGITLSAALCTAALTQDVATAAVSPVLAEATCRAVMLTATGQGSSVGPQIATVVRAMTRGFGFARSKLLLGIGLAAALLVAGAGAVIHPGQAANQSADKAAPVAKAQALEARRPGMDLLGDPLLPGVMARLGTVRLRHGSEVTGVAFTARGKLLVSVGQDMVLRIWDPVTGRPLAAHRFDGYAAYGFACSPDGKTAAIGSQGPLFLLDLATGKKRDLSLEFQGSVRAVAFSPDGALLASCGDDQLLRIWDVPTGKLRHLLKGHNAGLRSVAFSLDGKLLASGGDDGTVCLWSATTGKQVSRLKGKGTWVMAVAFSPDGKLLAAGGEKFIRLWDVATGKEHGRLEGHKGGIQSIAFSASGRLLASAAVTRIASSGELKLWDTSTWKEIPRFVKVDAPYTTVALAPDGKTLAAGTGYHHHVRLWDVATGRELPSAGHHGPVVLQSISSDGKRVLTASYFGDHTLRLWEAATGRELHGFPADQGVLLPDGKTILSVLWSEPTVVHVWDADTGKELRRSTRPVADRFVTFSPNGKFAVSRTEKGTISVWRPDTGKELHRLKGPSGVFVPLALSQDGKLLATADDKAVTVWDVPNERALRKIGTDTTFRHHLAFSADGSLLAVELYGGGIQLWDVNTGNELLRLTGKEVSPSLRSVYCPAFSPDGRTLVTGCGEGSIGLWEVATGKLRHRLKGHLFGELTGFLFAPDRKVLVSGNGDNTALVWDLTTGTRMGAARFADGELKALWTDLTGADAARAYQALLKLSAHAAQAVPLLQQHLKPVPHSDTARIARLVADLGSKRFATRQKATTELEKLGESAAVPLRDAMARPQTAEILQRVRQLLDRLNAQVSVKRVWQSRALEVLEQVGTAEARALLRELAAGASGAWLTEEARKGLRRLK